MEGQGNPCLSSVLKYMDPNLRLRLISRAPQLRPFSTSAPLHLNHLEFEPLQTTINSTTYKLSIFKEWHPGRTEYGPNVTIDQDLDEYGFTMDAENLVKTAGDVDLRDSKALRYPKVFQDLERNSEAVEAELEKRVRFNENLLSMKLGKKKQETDFVEMFENAMDISKEPGTSAPNNQVNLPFSKSFLDDNTIELQKRLTTARANYLPFQCRRNNLAPPYTAHLQLIITSPSGVQVYRTPYTMKLVEALKKIHEFFFEKRAPVTVTEMVISPDVKILRIPAGLKFKPLSLSTPIEALCPFKTILAKSDYALNSLTIKNVKPKHLACFYFPAVRRARTLIIANSFYERDSWRAVFRAVANRHVVLKNEGNKFNNEDALGLIKDWIDNVDRCHGATMTFGLKKESTARKFLTEVGKQWEPVQSSKTCVIVPMKDKKRRLIISYQEVNSNPMEENSHESKWILKLKIGKAKK